MTYQYDLAPLIDGHSDREKVRATLGTANYFHPHILTYQGQALKVWRSVLRRYTTKEQEYDIPYSLAETAKLYAIDAMCTAEPLVEDRNDLFLLAEFFTVFYLMVHFFDDHVEHRDKFYSKFDFAPQGNIDTQRGAAPFSFLLVSFSLLSQILNDITTLSTDAKHTIIQKVYDALALQTRYFAAERQSNLDIEEILEMKQRQVSGKTMSLFGDVLGLYLKLSDKKREILCQGLVYLGSLTQITDDIRDQAIDRTLRNANIVLSAQELGLSAANSKLSSIYTNEAKLAANYLKRLYSEEEVYVLLSLPFYPFIVNKQQLKKGL
jgi:hypothetical protein